MTRHLRRINTWLRLLLILGAGALMHCDIGSQSVRAADNLPQLRMDRFSLENRLANLRGKHPFLADTNAMHDLRQAEKIALTYPDVRSKYQAARSQIFELMLPAFPSLSTMAIARPGLEDEAIRLKAAGSADDQESQLRSLQLRLDGFETNAFYVSDWCQLDVLMLCSCADSNTANALREARRMALAQITNGAPPDLIKTALAASQLELEAGDAILRMQELNRAIRKLAVSKTDLAPSENTQHAFSRMETATSSVSLIDRLVLFPATELLASTTNDALTAVPAYLDKWEARTNAPPVQDKGSYANNSSLASAGKVLRRWGVWGAVGLILIGTVWMLVRKLADSRAQQAQTIRPKKVYSNVLGEEVQEDESRAPPPPPPAAKTAKECFAQGFVGTGMDMLEQAVKSEPKNFDRRMELAKAHFQYCHNPQRAAQIVRQLLESGGFTQEQEAQARAILKEWE